MSRSARNRGRDRGCPQAKISVEHLSESKTGGTLGKPPREIVDPGVSWRKFFRAILTVKAVIAIFPLPARYEGVMRFTRRLSQTMTKSLPFLILQGKEMMLFPASPFVFLD